MPSIRLSIIPHGQPTAYNLRFQGATDETRDSNYNDLTAQHLRAKLREKLSLDDEEIDKIMARVEAGSLHQDYYPVDEQIYKCVFV